MTYASLMASLNPLAWYRLGEASGTVMHDASGNGRDGTYTGVTLAAGGALGTGGDSDTAVTTTGSAASVGSVPYASWMNGFTGFSVVGWVKFTTTGTAFFFSRTGNTAYNYGLFVAGKKLSMGVRASGSNAATGATDSNDGAWHFAVGTWDGTTIRIYRDGALDGSQALSGTLVTQLNDLQLGGRAANYIAASMDEVAIFGTVLSATDVARLYAAATTAPAVTTLAGTIGAVTGAFSVGLSTNDVALVGAIPAVTGSFSLLVGAAATPVTLDGQIPAVTGAFTVGFVGNVSLAGGIPAVTGSAALTPVPLSQWATAVRALGADVLWWARLNDGDGSATLWDASGNGHHGTYTDPWTVQPAVVGDGASVTFEQGSVGSSGHADVPTTGWLDAANGPDEFTLLVWAYRGPSTGGDLFDSDHDLDAVINLVSGPDTDAKIQTTTGSYSITEHLVPTGPALLAITYEVDTVNGYKLWRNAVQRAALNTTGGAVPDWSNATLRLGSASFTTDAPMDEALIVGRALSGAEITALYLAGLAADASLAGNIPAVTAAFTVLTPLDVSLTGTIRAFTGAFTVLTPREVSLAGSVPPVTGAFTMTAVTPVTLAGTIGAVTGSFTLPTGEVSLAGVQQNVQGSFAIAREQGLVLAGTIGPVTGVFALTGSYQVTLTGAIPAVTSSFLLTFPPQTDTGNRASGRTRLGAGYVFYEPPVVEPPDFSIAQHAFVSARAYTSVNVTGGRAVVASPVKAIARRARDRVVVGGRDVTFFRGVATPAPSYTLVAPLLYGPATLNLPQVAAAFEAPGVGDLAWCAKGKKVLVQRVDPDTNEVIATDYKGIVVAHDISGRTLQLQIGGEATGRAALIDKQPPLFFKRNDLGFWWWGALQDLGLRFEPRLGIDTGIVLRNAGGMSQLDYMNDLSAKGTRRNGAQLTCMPDRHSDGGAYRVVTKDLETVTATVYLDDTVTVPDVRDDLAEQPNRVFATGVTPEGMRVKFGAYPVLRDDTPPPYPMTDGSHFGVGTTDGDTDTGDGVSVMIWRLVKAGYLALADKPGGFDDDVADAIRDLKQDAFSGFSVIDGNMTPAAWAALFDTSATGYSLAGTQILPAAQRSTTRKWNRTANGSVIGLNDDYDPSVPLVDTTIDAGVGMTRRQIRGFARGELTPATEANYVGTITLTTGAVIAGDHTPGDPVTEADVLDARALRPGDNISAPLFGGGTLFHVAGVDRRVDDQGVTTIVLDVDTQARDTMKVWEVIRRNRDSRRNPARAWLNQHRSSSLTKDSVIEFDEIGGVLDDRVDLAGSAWTVFPVVAGQEGTIGRLYLETIEPTEFVVAVFGREVQASMLRDVIGNPLTKGGKKKWLSPTIRKSLDEDHVLLYIAGDKRNPCGYYPSLKHPADDPLAVDASPDDETDGPDFTALTGEWKDSAGFGYRTFSAPVLWVAIWAATASHLTPGRIMWPQLEAGS